jgi:hypothetical protein
VSALQNSGADSHSTAPEHVNLTEHVRETFSDLANIAASGRSGQRESERPSGATFHLRKEGDSEPLRGLCPCALCAASGAGAPPRKRGEERGSAKQKGRTAGNGSGQSVSSQPERPKDNQGRFAQLCSVRASAYDARTRQKLAPRHAHPAPPSKQPYRGHRGILPKSYARTCRIDLLPFRRVAQPAI